MYISDIGHQHPVRKSVNRFVKAADTNLKKKYAWHWEELSPGAIAKNQFINRRQAACAQHSCSPQSCRCIYCMGDHSAVHGIQAGWS